jgi:hypothetical protein
MAPYAETCSVYIYTYVCVVRNNIHVTVLQTGTFSDNARFVWLTPAQYEDTPYGTAVCRWRRVVLLTVVDIMESSAALIFSVSSNSEDGGSTFLKTSVNTHTATRVTDKGDQCLNHHRFEILKLSCRLCLMCSAWNCLVIWILVNYMSRWWNESIAMCAVLGSVTTRLSSRVHFS